MQNTRKILIVDDTIEMLDSVVSYLSRTMKDTKILKAGNGQDAVSVLAREDVSLIITDVRMPIMDGLGLLAHVSEHYPHIPCIVMTAFGKPDLLSKYNKGSIVFLEKPFELTKLVEHVRELFDAVSRDNLITGVSLGSFLQLLSMEESTCLIRVTSETEEWGGVYIKDGEVHEAIINGLNGEEALYKMLSWTKVGISYRQLPNKIVKRRIFKDVVNLVLEGMRRRDEQNSTQDHDDDDEKAVVQDNTESEMPRLFDDDPESLGDLDRVQDIETREEQAGPPEEVQEEDVQEEVFEPFPQLEEETKMALDKYLQDLQDINGYKASAIMNFTGEILQSHSADPKIDLAVMGATFNDIFRQAHTASTKVGLDACSESVITTPKGTIIMRCSGVNEKVHFHTIAILAKDGNQALMKMKLEKMQSGVMNELA